MALTDEFRDVLGGPAPRAPRLGIEHEYAVWHGDHLVDFGDLIATLAVPGRAVHPLDPRVYRTATGLAVLADGDVAEVASPPVAVEPGFGAAIAAWADHGREVLASTLPPDHRIEGGSTHISVEVDPALGDTVALRYVTTFAPALMLLLDGPESPGLLVRPRPGRTELCGEYAAGEQLRAAAVFAAGSVLACAAGAVVPAVDLAVEPGRRRWGWYVDRSAAGVDLYDAGRAAVLRLAAGGTTTAQAHLEACWAVARRALAGHASGADLAAVDQLVRGRMRLPLRSVSDLDHLSTAITHRTVEGLVLDPPQRPGLDVDLAVATWDFAAFAVRNDQRDAVACVPHDRLDRFLERLDQGDLDAVLTAYLAAPPAQRVLASAGQTTEPGLYDSVAKSAALLPADRVGVGAGAVDPLRPGKLVEPPPPTTIVEEEHHRRWWPWVPIAVVVLLLITTALVVLPRDEPTSTSTGSTPPPPPPTETGTCGEGLGGPIFDAELLTQPCTYTDTGGDPYESCTGPDCTEVALEIPFDYGMPCSYVDHFPDTPAVDPDTGQSGPSLLGFYGWTTARPGTVFRIDIAGPTNQFGGVGTVADNGIVNVLVPIDSFGVWELTDFFVVSSPDSTLTGMTLDPRQAEPNGFVSVSSGETTCEVTALTEQANRVALHRASGFESLLGRDTLALRSLLAILTNPGVDAALTPTEGFFDVLGLRIALDGVTLGVIVPGEPTVHSAPGIDPVAPEGETRVRYKTGAMVAPTSAGTTDVWFRNTAFPCGPGQAALTVCPQPGAPVDDGPFVMAAAVVDGPVPLADATNHYQYGFAFDADGDPATGYVPPPEFSNDFFSGADRFYSAGYDPEQGWSLNANEPTAARILIRNNAVVLLVPATEFTVANPSFRVTTFRHTGDFGLEGGDWSGDVEPVVGAFAPLFGPTITVAAPPGAPGPSTTTTTVPPVEDPVAFVAGLQDARRTGDLAFLFDRLHPAVLERYGEPSCRAFVGGLAIPSITYAVAGVTGPAPWDWVTDGLTRTIDGTYFLDTTVSSEQVPPAQVVLHVTPVDREQRYFVDCGDPLPGAP